MKKEKTVQNAMIDKTQCIVCGKQALLHSDEESRKCISGIISKNVLFTKNRVGVRRK